MTDKAIQLQKSPTQPKTSLKTSLHKRAKSATSGISLTPLQIFERLCEIPHKSYHTQEMFSYLCSFCEDLGLEVRTDKARNIYIYKKPLKCEALSKQCEASPKICLQAHYDMVGVGRAQDGEAIETYVDSCGFLRARESSLGADNGVGVASILWLFTQERYAPYIEAILTNDEEVGLCGANELELPIKSNFLLNLDSEFFGEIIIGCAGGFDVEFDFCVKDCDKDCKKGFVRDFACADSDLAVESVEKEARKTLYEIKAFGFEGGHSGVDIHRNIRSSIVDFAHLLEAICECCEEGSLYDLRCGEKSNSIPVGLEAIMGFSLQGEDLQRALQKAGLLVESVLGGDNFRQNDSGGDELRDSLGVDSLCGCLRVGIAEKPNDTKSRNEDKNKGIKMGFLLKPCSDIGDYKQILEQKPYDKGLLSKVILALRHGVWERGENGEVLSSLNIAMIEPTQKSLKTQKLHYLGKICDSGDKDSSDKRALHFTLKARANTNALLKSTKSHIVHILQRLLESPTQDLGKEPRKDLHKDLHNNLPKTSLASKASHADKNLHISKNDSCVNITISNEYGAWENAKNTHAQSPILQMIIDAYKWRHCEVGSIHAGLECGILQERFAKMGLAQISMASIGPTILSPHSLQERLDLGSFDEFARVLVDLLDRICASKPES